MSVDPRNAPAASEGIMTAESFILNNTEWLFLRTLELGELDLAKAEAALARLEALGLVSKKGAAWRATEYGKFLSASRRSI